MRAELGRRRSGGFEREEFRSCHPTDRRGCAHQALPPAKITQLRDEVRRRRDEFRSLTSQAVGHAGATGSSDRSARRQRVFYLDRPSGPARRRGTAGANAGSGQTSVQMAHAGIDQRRFTDVDRVLTEMRSIGAPARSCRIAEGTGTNQQASQKADQPQFLDLAQARLAQEIDRAQRQCALLCESAARLRSQEQRTAADFRRRAGILDRARTTLDAGDADKAEAMAQWRPVWAAPRTWTL